MAIASLADRLRAGDQVLSGWISLPDLSVTELSVRAGFSALVLDMQHGMVDITSAFKQIALMRQMGAEPVLRVPVGEFQTASRLLDAGAAMVIAPMINSVADAAEFGSFMKYVPLGQRSWGPTRAVQLKGGTAADYALGANRSTLAVPMIETRAALDALDGILALESVDGVFVGPGDLSVALSGLIPINVEAPENVAAIEHVAKRARAAGKFAAIFAGTGALARKYFDMGYGFVTVGTDVNYLMSGAKAAIDSVGQVATGPAKDVGY